MITTLHIFILLSLALILYQDLRYRGISPMVTGMIFMMNISLSILLIGSYNLLYYSVVNSVILLFDFAAIFTYVKLRFGSKVGILDRYLGWGDVIFFIALVPAFSPPAFLAFIVLSLLLIILYYALLRIIKVGHIKFIPLAGIIAAFFSVLLLFEYFSDTSIRYCEFNLQQN